MSYMQCELQASITQQYVSVITDTKCPCHPGVLSSGFGGSTVRHGLPIALGHAHNDEKHEVPLFGALAEGAPCATS